MITIIITSFKEPLTIGKAIDSFLNQNIKENYEIIVSCPDKETALVVKEYSKKHRQVKHFQDEGKGKLLALNKIIKEFSKSDILILTDGDVFVSENSVHEILEAFKDPKVGCVTGRPVSLNTGNSMFGYWSHLLLYGAHKARLKRSNKERYFTSSGYLYAFRTGIVKEFDVNIVEDAIIPFMFLVEGYKLKYLPEAKVYVKYPDNFDEWLTQKKRVSKAYLNMEKTTYKGRKVPKMKSFLNEVLEGTFIALTYPRNIKEVFYTLMLFPARLYMWFFTYYESKIKKQLHTDAWKRIESTKNHE
ncbi:MAG: glycosyltransferase [Nanoarchaeota archaeon]